MRPRFTRTRKRAGVHPSNQNGAFYAPPWNGKNSLRDNWSLGKRKFCVKNKDNRRQALRIQGPTKLIDGCSRVGIFFKIILPLLKPITATVIILNGVTIWNDYQFSIFFLQSSKVRTIPVALSTFFSQFQSDLGYVAAGCIVGMLPLVILYLALQKYFIKGIADGAIKG